jgi:hypothetical protein
MERKESMVKRHLPSAYSAFLDGGIAARIKEPLFETGLTLRSDKSAWGGLRPSVAALLDDRVPIDKDAWQSFFAFLTYFQFLGHDFMSFTMKSKDDPFWMNLVSVHSSMSIGGDLEWDDAFAMVDGDMFCTAVLKVMRAEGLPAPQMFEDVFDAEGVVFASPWMQWPDKKLMALPPDDIADIKLIEPWCAIPLDVGASPETFVKSFKEAYNG